ncbi:hypothetical protein ACHAXA_002803 [Cyclostephanos tholiformis]|uniref:Uncharacterized protein n=1 Tax=Cyclostephanos tholiformis TaxID=382380 RepID=A0ABD3RAY0_9STRA
MSNGESTAWKIFNRDTEAGRLLSKLYGVAPRVSYPEPRRRTAAIVKVAAVNDDDHEGGASMRLWKTTCTVHGRDKKAEEAKELERKKNFARALSLAVPRVGRNPTTIDGASRREKIDLIPRRKTEAVCRNTVDEALNKKRMYRPPCSREISTDEEKARLQRIMSGDSPNPLNSTQSGRAESDAVSTQATMFDQLLSEINERRQHQLAMEEMGAGEDTRKTTANEIKERLKHLKRLDPPRALAVAQELRRVT